MGIQLSKNKPVKELNGIGRTYFQGIRTIAEWQVMEQLAHLNSLRSQLSS